MHEEPVNFASENKPLQNTLINLPKTSWEDGKQTKWIKLFLPISSQNLKLDKNSWNKPESDTLSRAFVSTKRLHISYSRY